MKVLRNKTAIKIITASLAVLFVLLVVALIINLVKLSAENSRRAELSEKTAYLDTVIAENGALLDYCKTPSYIEDYARLYLGMIEDGEIVIEVK